MAVVHQNEEEEEVQLEKRNHMTIVPTTLATIESLTFPLVQEVVLLADFRCKTCQDRVADIVSKLNGDAESIEIGLTEKKVTITFSRKNLKMPENNVHLPTIDKNPVNKCSLVKRILRSSYS